MKVVEIRNGERRENNEKDDGTEDEERLTNHPNQASTSNIKKYNMFRSSSSSSLMINGQKIVKGVFKIRHRNKSTQGKNHKQNYYFYSDDNDKNKGFLGESEAADEKNEKLSLKSDTRLPYPIIKNPATSNVKQFCLIPLSTFQHRWKFDFPF